MQSDAVKLDASGAHPAVEIKGSMFTLPVLRLRSADLALLETDLSQRLAQHLSFFEHAPVVIDLEQLKEELPDFNALADLLRRQRLVPVGIRQATAEQNAAAIAAGLAVLKGGALPATEKAAPKPARSVKSEPVAAPAPAPVARSTKVVSQPVRSGQRIYAQGGDLILLAPVNAGAEVMADGNIHIYAPLRGRALAGVLGDAEARIFVQSMEAELVAIAGNYQVFEDSLPAALRGKAVQIHLDGTQLLLTPLQQAG